VNVGDRKGRWILLRLEDRKPKHWLCRCDCGTERVIRQDHLASGASRSCGCLAWDTTISRSEVHGDAHRGKRAFEYRVWVGIRKRCLNPNDNLYPHYGGRGIRICERWLNSYEAFLEDVGRSPSEKLTLDRIDNDGDYEPGNVRWTTRTEQARNTRRNRRIEFRGEVRVLAEWAERLGIPYKVLHGRINKHGWSVERAFTSPYRRRS
jgi:hypothetical protein